MGASQMEVTGTLGMVLNGPLETGQILSHPNSDLNLESASGSLTMVGRGGVLIQDGPAFEGVEIMSNEKLSISSRSQVRAVEITYFMQPRSTAKYHCLLL